MRLKTSAPAELDHPVESPPPAEVLKPAEALPALKNGEDKKRADQSHWIVFAISSVVFASLVFYYSRLSSGDPALDRKLMITELLAKIHDKPLHRLPDAESRRPIFQAALNTLTGFYSVRPFLFAMTITSAWLMVISLLGAMKARQPSSSRTAMSSSLDCGSWVFRWSMLFFALRVFLEPTLKGYTPVSLVSVLGGMFWLSVFAACIGALGAWICLYPYGDFFDHVKPGLPLAYYVIFRENEQVTIFTWTTLGFGALAFIIGALALAPLYNLRTNTEYFRYAEIGAASMIASLVYASFPMFVERYILIRDFGLFL